MVGGGLEARIGQRTAGGLLRRVSWAALSIACARTPGVATPLALTDAARAGSGGESEPPARAAGEAFRARVPFVVPATGALAPALALPPVAVTVAGARGRLFRAPTYLHRMHCRGRERSAGESESQCAHRIFRALTPRDLEVFEAAFARTNPRTWETPRNDPALRARLASYRREYVGIVLMGEDRMVVQLLCPGIEERPDGDMTLVFDGGACVLGAVLLRDGTLRVWAHGGA